VGEAAAVWRHDDGVSLRKVELLAAAVIECWIMLLWCWKDYDFERIRKQQHCMLFHWGSPTVPTNVGRVGSAVVQKGGACSREV